MLRAFLNNNPCQNAVGELDRILEVFELNLELYGYLYSIEGSLTFIGEDYNYLLSLYDNEYCQDVEVIIQYSPDSGNSWTNKIKGLIRLSGVKWDKIKRQAICPVTDNSYLAKINNNRNTQFTLGSYDGIVLSKNGVDVSDRAVYQSDCILFSPFRGRTFQGEALYTKSTPPFPASEGNDIVDMRIPGRSGIFIWDALNLIIGMMTDGEVDFASDYLTYSLVSPLDFNEDAFSMLFSGQMLKHGSLYPTISFGELFPDLHNLSNLWFTLEVGSNGKPVFRVEDEDYFRQSNSNFYFNSIETLFETIDLRKVYSRVIVGCSQSPGDFPAGEIKLIQHMQEEFPLSGICNVDNALDLRLQKLIISTNAIASVLPSISGFSTGSLLHRKFTTEETTAAQKLTDSAIGFQEQLIGQGFLIRNTQNNQWSYINGVPDNTNILITDTIFTVDNTGLAKNYEIYKPSDSDNLLDEVFLIQFDRSVYDASSIFLAQATVITPPGDIYIYNETYSNANVITRHMGGVAQSIVNSMTDGNDEFSAELDPPSVLNLSLDDTQLNNYVFSVAGDVYRRVRFNDDTNSPFFDTNGNYDSLTGIYTAPAPGYYTATTTTEIVNNIGAGDDYIQQIELVRVSPSGDVLESEVGSTTILDLTSFSFTLTRTFYLDEGERIEVWVKKRQFTGAAGTPFQFEDWDAGPNGYGRTDGDTFEVTALENGGGNVPASDPAEARLLNVEIECSVSRSDFDTILANPYKYYHVPYYPNEGVSGFIGRISRGILNGETTLNLFKRKDGV